MNNRISELRKNRGWTQDRFAEEMGISKNYVSLIENGKKIPSDRLISDICQEFRINEEWLRNGTEPMKLEFSKEDKLGKYLGKIATGNDDFIRDLIEVYMELDETSKDALKLIAKRMADKQNERERQ